MPNKRSSARKKRGSKRVSKAASRKDSKPSARVAHTVSASSKKRTVKAEGKKKKAALTANPFTAEFFPMPPGNPYSHEHNLKSRSSAANFVGVCFSGGGSRSVSATMRQFRGLKLLNLLDEI